MVHLAVPVDEEAAPQADCLHASIQVRALSQNLEEDLQKELLQSPWRPPDVEGQRHKGVKDDEVGNEVKEGGQMEPGACSSGEEGGEGGALGLLPPGAAQGQDGAKEDQEDKDLTGGNKG